MIKRRLISASASLAAGVLVALAGVAPAAVAAPSGARAHDVAQSQAEILRYWTPKRMRNAEPLDLPSSPGPASAPPPVPQGLPVLIRGRPPAAGSVAARAVGTDFETSPAADTVFPQSVNGKIFFTKPSGTNASCSGTVVDSPYENLVLTAAHCVYDAETRGGYVSNLVFIPGYRDRQRPFGTWTAEQLIAPAGWTKSNGHGTARANDIGVAVINPLGSTLEAAVGARGIAFNQKVTSWQIFGYPGHPNASEDNGFDHQVGDYNGLRLIGCNASSIGSLYPSTIYAAPCYMKEGASGGGWVIAGTDYLNSVVSFGSDKCPADYSECGRSAGPYFGSTAKCLYDTGVAAGAPSPAKAVTRNDCGSPKRCRKKKGKKRAASAKKRKCKRHRRR